MVEIMIGVSIISALAAIAIPNLLRSKISSNEASAKATLKTIATGMENYYLVNNYYPGDPVDLTTATPPYIAKNYFNGIHYGYIFNSTLSDYAYTITAAPSASSQGTAIFTATTGAVIEEVP